MSVSNHTYTLYTAQAAAAGTAFPLDYRFDGTQNRTVYCNKNTADTILVETTPDGTNWFSYYLFPVGVTTGSIVLVGPHLQVRVTKTGAAATCTVLLLG